jgi:hypothetical protein
MPDELATSPFFTITAGSAVITIVVVEILSAQQCQKTQKGGEQRRQTLEGEWGWMDFIPHFRLKKVNLARISTIHFTAEAATHIWTYTWRHLMQRRSAHYPTSREN